MINVERERIATPGCAFANHLNNAGASLPPKQVTDAVIAYLEYEALHGGYETHAALIDQIEEFYENAARLLNCRPVNIAFQVNATEAFSKALSSIPFSRGDVILTSINDYTSNQIQFLSLSRRLGVRVIHAPDLPEGGIDAQAIRELILEHSPRIVSVSHVPTNSGLVQDVNSVGEICSEYGIPYLVDACQSAGQMPLDVTSIKCDFLSATMRKFLRGPRGGGFLYISDRALENGYEPLMIDMRGADMVSPSDYVARTDARRFEGWEHNYGVVRGSAVAIRHALELGLEHIRDRNYGLSGRLRDGLNAIAGVSVLDRGRGPCAIVTCNIEHVSWQEVKAHMTSRKINCSVALKQNNQLDFGSEGKDVPWALRLSPHYYNTEEEIDQALDAVWDLAH